MKRHALRPGTVDRARKLRRNATDAESILWFALRDKLPMARFRRQVPFGSYFADFASHGAKLIVEVDGGQHKPDRDAARTRFLEGEGYKVIRFWNNDVLRNLDGVLQTIAAALPSPLVGEGGAQRRMRGSFG
jgi:very-short-patch-repair endonuclease